MEVEDNRVIDSGIIEPRIIARRRKLLPWWIKFFVWVFMIMGVIAPFGLIFALFGMHFQIALYGIETYNPLSVAGLGLTFVYVLKAIAAFGLWTEKDWAITIAQADAILGLVLCAFSMLILPLLSDHHFTLFRLEIIILIPYLIKLIRIKQEWLNRSEKLIS